MLQDLLSSPARLGTPTLVFSLVLHIRNLVKRSLLTLPVVNADCSVSRRHRLYSLAECRIPRLLCRVKTRLYAKLYGICLDVGSILVEMCIKASARFECTACSVKAARTSWMQRFSPSPVHIALLGISAVLFCAWRALLLDA